MTSFPIIAGRTSIRPLRKTKKVYEWRIDSIVAYAYPAPQQPMSENARIVNYIRSQTGSMIGAHQENDYER